MDDANVCVVNPASFKIKRIANFTEYTLVEVLYSDPVTRMILLFHATNHAVLGAEIVIPDFSAENPLHLLATLRPDNDGWMHGVELALALLPEPTDLPL